DGPGSTRIATQSISGQAPTAPVLSSLPAPSTIQCPATPSSTTPPATGSCGPGPSVRFAGVPTPGTCPQAYSVTRTWTTKDCTGRSEERRVGKSVQDATGPVISSLPAPSTITCPATPASPTPTRTDECPPGPSATGADHTTQGT